MGATTHPTPVDPSATVASLWGTMAPPIPGTPSATIAPPSPENATAADRSVINFGNYLSAALAPFYQGVTDYVAARLGRPALLAAASSLGELTAGDVDVGFL